MVKAPDTKRIVARYNDCINRQDLDGLTALMAEEHRIVDSAGGTVEGKAESVAAWAGFFRSFPDYRNHFDRMISRGGTVVVTGRSTCRDPRLDGPAIWVAEITGGLLAEWRIYEDSPETRTRLRVD